MLYFMSLVDYYFFSYFLTIFMLLLFYVFRSGAFKPKGYYKDRDIVRDKLYKRYCQAAKDYVTREHIYKNGHASSSLTIPFRE